MALESNKKELVLGTNVFSKPTELVGPKAWSQLILNLLFLRPGTYPSQPMMGVGIQDYEYEFLDDAISRLNSSINEQIRMYLPDIPLEGIEVKATDYNGRKILFIVIKLYDDGSVVTAVVAAELKNHIIDFDISWAN